MPKEFVFSLDLFSSRYNIPIENLSWGIRIQENENVSSSFKTTVVVLIKDQKGYINIENDKIEPEQLPCFDFTFEDADMSESDKEYIFLSANSQIKILKESIAAFYASKYFSKETIKYILGA
ncbi:MAG: hypothetical protein ACK5N8_01875 [Alphaproteobacteria bacterium]